MIKIITHSLQIVIASYEKTVCKKNRCTGCAACLSVCPKKSIEILDNARSYNARIDLSRCIKCYKCEKICPQNNPVTKVMPKTWYQGWANDEQIRSESSSGGIATAIATAFVKNGGVCCSCTFERGNLVFKFTSVANDVKHFSGSKYVKSNPDGIYGEICERLNRGEKVLFIGLPCQVAAVKKFVGNKKKENLYTIDLICHGTPSPILLDLFLKESSKDLKKIKNLKFRRKTNCYLSDGYIGIKPPNVRDRYTFAFLRALNYTENCYSCQYATFDRTSDITLGDSWGSQLPKEEQDKGISLVLCQNKHGEELLEIADLHLEYVDIKRAIANNKQLKQPSIMSSKRDVFFNCLYKTYNFNKSVFRCYPMTCFKQDIKSFLSKAKIFSGNTIK